MLPPNSRINHQETRVQRIQIPIQVPVLKPIYVEEPYPVYIPMAGPNRLPSMITTLPANVLKTITNTTSIPGTTTYTSSSSGSDTDSSDDENYRQVAPPKVNYEPEYRKLLAKQQAMENELRNLQQQPKYVENQNTTLVQKRPDQYNVTINSKNPSRADYMGDSYTPGVYKKQPTSTQFQVEQSRINLATRTNLLQTVQPTMNRKDHDTSILGGADSESFHYQSGVNPLKSQAARRQNP